MGERVTELRCKEIIGLENGTRYGYVGDVELDLETGQVLALVVPGLSLGLAPSVPHPRPAGKPEA